jgi:hypothetical protein
MGLFYDIRADQIPFDTIEKEPRFSIEDSRQLICIDVDRVGSGYRAVINGLEYQLPDGIATIEDAAKVACDIAIREVNKSLREIIQRVY